MRTTPRVESPRHGCPRPSARDHGVRDPVPATTAFATEVTSYPPRGPGIEKSRSLP
jgi:hypothetical protein